MHANKSFNRNPANHRLYHALIEALIEDENTMDKGVADTVKDHKRKHDDDEDDDDEDLSTRLNQGKKTKNRRTKESESSKKSSFTKETSKGKAPTKGSKTEQPWFNQMVSALKDPFTFNDLMATPIDFFKHVLNGLKINNLTQDILLGPAFNLLKGTCSSSIELEGYRTVVVDYFFNNDLEYLKTFDPKSLRANELYKFSDGTLKSVYDELHHRVFDFRLDYKTEMPTRKWTAVDRKRSGLMIELIDKKLRERKIIRNLERLVGAQELEMDYKLMTLTIVRSYLKILYCKYDEYVALDL
nr:hypothetical protein [Tanacetum cinerariifolium]